MYVNVRVKLREKRERKMKKCVIWGTGIYGQNVIRDLVNFEFDIYAYCDSDVSKQGEILNGIEIISPEVLREVCLKREIDCIVIGVRREDYVAQIREQIKELVPDYIDVIGEKDIANAFENEYLLSVRKNLQYQWSIDFLPQSAMWIENFMEEVLFWVNHVAKPNTEWNYDYEKRLNNSEFLGLDGGCTEMATKLKDNAIVMDIGCGLVSKYGETLPNAKQIKVIPIDPLAPYYNEINRIYSGGRNSKKEKCQFGLFEFMANFYKQNYADAIIINNALDHCIDPYKSILECLFILKVGGQMRLNHRRAEAVFERYQGLHKWNLDYDENNNFIIWNKQNAINISDKLKDIVQIHIYHTDDYIKREKQKVVVTLTKKNNFVLEEYIDMNDERYQLAAFLENLMSWTATSRVNKRFNELLND